MSNLITADRKVMLRRIFYTRLGIVFLSWVLTASLLVFISFFSIFVFTKNELHWQKEALANLETTLESYKTQSKQSNIGVLLKVANIVLQKRQPLISNALMSTLSLLADANVTPKKIVIKHPDAADSQDILVINISALSKDKEHITHLLKVIKSSKLFTGLNVSNLVSSLRQDKYGNVHFEFSLNYQEK